MRTDLRLIRYFVAVAEELHFRRAAEQLNIAQPALTRAIQTLEAELGVVLFLRSNRNVQITTAGRVFQERAREILSLADRSMQDVRNAHEGRTGTLSIGYTDFAIAGALPTILKEFQEQHPDITLKPQHGVTMKQLNRLENGTLDVGFITGPLNAPGFEECPVMSEPFVCVCPDTHPLAEQDHVRLQDLAHEDFVHGSPDHWQHFYDYLLPLCRRAGFVPRIVQEAFNTAGIVGLVACGMGVTILTEKVCAALPPGLAVRPIEGVEERLLTTAIWPKSTRGGPAEHFISHLKHRSMAEADLSRP